MGDVTRASLSCGILCNSRILFVAFGLLLQIEVNTWRDKRTLTIMIFSFPMLRLLEKRRKMGSRREFYESF